MASLLDIVGLLTTPVSVAARGPESRHGQNRYAHGLDTGQVYQPMPSAAAPSVSTFREAAENLYAPHFMCHSAIGAYAEVMCSMPIRVYQQRADGDREEIEDSELNALFAKPNPAMDGIEFIYASVVSLLLGGEAPIEKIKNMTGTRIVNMELMRPDQFGPIVHPQKGLVGYQYVVGDDGTGYDVDEIMFYKLGNPTNQWRGMSPLTAARLSIETDLFAGRYNKSFLQNGSLPGGVLQTEQDLLPDERKEMRKEWEAVHRGVDKQGRVAVLDKGLKFDGTTISQRDAQWLEGRLNDGEAIRVVYRIPGTILGIERTTNRSTADVLYRSWLKGPVRALARRLEFKFTHELAHTFDKRWFVEFDMDSMLRPELEHLADAGSKAWWITPNEKRRAWHNLPKLDGGDEMWVPVNMAAGGTPTTEVAPMSKQRAMRPFGR